MNVFDFEMGKVRMSGLQALLCFDFFTIFELLFIKTGLIVFGAYYLLIF
jgi:hypothetical protein